MNYLIKISLLILFAHILLGAAYAQRNYFLLTHNEVAFTTTFNTSRQQTKANIAGVYNPLNTGNRLSYSLHTPVNETMLLSYGASAETYPFSFAYQPLSADKTIADTLYYTPLLLSLPIELRVQKIKQQHALYMGVGIEITRAWFESRRYEQYSENGESFTADFAFRNSPFVALRMVAGYKIMLANTDAVVFTLESRITPYQIVEASYTYSNSYAQFEGGQIHSKAGYVGLTIGYQFINKSLLEKMGFFEPFGGLTQNQ